jgi:hypothetical protein
MMPKRISLKCFVTPDPRAPIELHPVTGLFHRFIQQSSLDGLLIDVADYAHVPDGPGVILIGHDVDYGIDLADGRAGLLTTRKRLEEVPLEAAVADTWGRALRAVRAIESDAATSLRFDCSRFELRLLDRLAAPNQDAAFSAACKQIEPLAARLYGADGFTLSRLSAAEPRRPLGIAVGAGAAQDAAALIARLSAAA